MSQGETEEICPFCGAKLWVVDMEFECRKCGANETMDKKGNIWTRVKLPIGLIQKKEKVARG